jgi:hypothetical protein
MSDPETAWSEDDMHQLAAFMLDYIQAYEAYRDAVTRRVRLWERSTGAVFDVVKQVMQVSEKNAAIVMKTLESINNYLSQLVGLDRASLARALEAKSVPVFTEHLARVDIGAFRAQLEIEANEGKPAALETQGMKKFLKYMT